MNRLATIKSDNILMIVVILSTLFLLLSCSQPAGSDESGVFETISPEEAGLSREKLDSVVDFCEKSGSAALLMLYDGKVVLSWGEVETKYPIHSIRKALLNSLYGIHVERGDIDLDVTLQALGIDDIPPVLTEEEKQAKVFDLIRSRSGVYHPAAAEAQVMIDSRPERGSHAPGSFFYYNNWDFNALGTIFEQETGRGIYEAFYQEIATPLGMKDFQVEDGMYQYEKEKSLHPAYHFYMTAHDLALYGLLYMNDGTWNGRQIVPQAWIAESTRLHSLMEPETGMGYGYLWYVLPEELGLGRVFLHTGVGIHMLSVMPDLKVVVVHRVDTLADDIRFTGDDMGHLVALLTATLADLK
jgi:CubicO group peptidase (beta-lactamase class C family)